jgi:hypothetical protein
MRQDLSQARDYGMDWRMSELNPYQREQLESLDLAADYLRELSPRDRSGLDTVLRPYMEFRTAVDAYLAKYFSRFCTHSCYTTQTSACCSRDGIITFWADMLINAATCDHEQVEYLRRAIQNPAHPHKCIYLGPEGCLWRVRPLVCAMFVCDDALQAAFDDQPEARRQWDDFLQQAKGFRWPDRPVLFDQLEKQCINAGVDSTLMYLHSSPGLLRVKRKAGLK